jgi:hypothetical protein
MIDLATHDDCIATIGMDLGKRSFHLIGMDARGKVIMRQKLSRGRLERHMANLQPCLVGPVPAHITSVVACRPSAMTFG